MRILTDRIEELQQEIERKKIESQHSMTASISALILISQRDALKVVREQLVELQKEQNEKN